MHCISFTHVEYFVLKGSIRTGLITSLWRVMTRFHKVYQQITASSFLHLNYVCWQQGKRKKIALSAIKNGRATKHLCVCKSTFSLNVIFWRQKKTQNSAYKVHVSIGGGGLRRSASYCRCSHHVETRGRGSDYPQQDMKRENSALAGLCSANIHGLGAAASLSPGSQRVTCFGVKRTGGWQSPFQSSASLQVTPLSHQCETTVSLHCDGGY